LYGMVWYGILGYTTRHSIGHFGDGDAEQWRTSPIQ